MDLRCISIALVLSYSALGNPDANRDCVKTESEKLVGVTEELPNDSPQIQTILENAGFDNPAPYCSATVKFVFDVCLVLTDITAWSPTAVPEERAVWKAGEPITRMPRPTDVFGMYSVRKGRISHVGIIWEWPDDSEWCLTFEGNTGVGNGMQGITIKRRRKSSIHIVCNWIDDETVNQEIDQYAAEKKFTPLVDKIKIAKPVSEDPEPPKDWWMYYAIGAFLLYREIRER